MLAGVSDAAMVRVRDGAELWTAVSGTGPPVVCLHGGPGLWDYLAPLLTERTGQPCDGDFCGCDIMTDDWAAREAAKDDRTGGDRQLADPAQNRR